MAHDAGIVHRDLKPSNVIRTPEGVVKLLDFGIATSVREQSEPGSVTMMSPGTRQGGIVGTASYMSPEQARGAAIDRRTDIWSFGCVAYELFCGRRAFEGQTETDTIAAVLRAEPDWVAIPSAVPARIRDLLRRCLEKDPARRIRDARDLRLTIEDLQAAPELPTARPEADRPAPIRRSSLWMMGAALVIVGAALGALAGWRWLAAEPAPPRQVMRFPLRMDPATLFQGQGPTMAISNDGTAMVYGIVEGLGQQLYLHRLGDLAPTPISGTSAANTPFFSPDGQWIGFWSGNKLKKVRTSGGEPVIVADDPIGRGATWLTDDTIVFSSRSGAKSLLYRVPASGGTPIPIKGADDKRPEHMIWPDALPGGRAVLFTSWADAVESSSIAVVSLDTGEVRVLVRNGSFPRYTPTGHLLFGRREGANTTLWAVAFDPETLQLSGEPLVVQDVQVNVGGAGQFDVSDDGTLVYVAPRLVPEKSLVWVDQTGAATSLVSARGGYVAPRLSPDGRRIAVSMRDKDKAEIWIHDIDRNGAPVRLTFENGLARAPIWSPDGQWIVFSSATGAGELLMRKRADGTGTAEPLTPAGGEQTASSWSPDGKWIALTERRMGNDDVMMLAMEGKRGVQPFVRTPFRDMGGSFSPDGQFIAYVSTETDRPQIHVRQFPDTGQKWIVSNTGGTEPVWARDGKKLFYRSGNRMLAAGVTTTPAFRATAPLALFDMRFDPDFAGGGRAGYDVAADGRFLFLDSGLERPRDLTLNVAVNWFEELTRRVPSPFGGR